MGIANQRSPVKCPPLSDTNARRRISWVKKYKKIDFQTVHFLMAKMIGVEDGLKRVQIPVCATNGNKEVVA